jgi:hypothetical protein
MPLNFPANPSLNDFYQFNGASYKWNGTKWENASFNSNAVITEFTDSVSQNSSTISINPSVHNYYKINIDGDISIDLPSSSPYSSFVMELNYAPISAGYNLTNASYDNASFSVTDQDIQPFALFFKSDGSKMYMGGAITDRIYQYTLSTPWDISTTSYDTVNFSVTSQVSVPISIFFKPDGTKLYVLDIVTDAIFQYTLSTPWAVNTSSYDNISFSIASQETSPYEFFFKPDGTKMYIIGTSNDTVYQYTLSTPWDISTTSYDTVSFSISAQDSIPTGISFNPDGTKMFIMGFSTDTIYQYTLSTPWEVNTATYDTVSFSVSAQQSAPYVIFFKSDGTKMYISGDTGDLVHQYSTGGSVAPTITWSNNILWAGGSAPTIDYAYASNILINFTTYDGSNWVANILSTDLRSS